MNHSALLRRAWDITRRYRVLWLFGILVALLGANGTTPSNNVNYNFGNGDLQSGHWPDWFPRQQLEQFIRGFDPSRYIGVFVACVCLLLLIGLVLMVLRYVARVALIRSVNQIETTGAAPTWRAGFRLGWSNRTFRLWLLELVVGILALIVIIVLLLLAGAPLLLLLAQNDAARVIGIATSALIGLPVALIIIAGIIVLSVVGQFWTREIVLRDASIGEAAQNGFARVRRHIRDVGILALLMAGIQIAFAILMIPVFIVVFIVAGLVGGGIGYALYALANSVGWAIGVGLPIFLVILIIPLTCIGGLFETFKSTVWTLGYREAVQLNGV